MCNKDIKMKFQTTKTKGINFIFKYSEEIPWKKKFSLHSKSRGPQKTQNICIYFKAHQHRVTFLGEAYGLLNSHLERDLLSSKDLLLIWSGQIKERTYFWALENTKKSFFTWLLGTQQNILQKQ